MSEDLAPAAAAPAFSAIIMAYDEVASLEGVVREVDATLFELGKPYEVLIVDDGSRDGTGARADLLAASLPAVRAVHHASNQGLGGVYRTGFRCARGRYLTFFPADGQFPSAILLEFAPFVETHDMVLGYLPARGDAWLGRLLSWCERILYRLLFGRMPRFQGVLLFRRELLDRFPLKATGRGWAVLMELIVRTQRAGCRTLSIPTEMRPRRSGRSKVNNWRTIWSNLLQAFALRRLL